MTTTFQPEVSIYIFRLNNNVEIIAELVADIGEMLILKDPMRFGVMQAESGIMYIQLGSWCPLSLYAERIVNIKNSAVILQAVPAMGLLKYYQNSVAKLEKMIEENPDGFSKIVTLQDLLLEDDKHSNDKSHFN